MSSPAASLQFSDPIRTYLRGMIKDDEDLLEHVLVVCFSSFTSNPLNLGVMAPTSEGKSYVISLVTSLFPNAVAFTGSSTKAFFYEEGKAVDPETHEDLQGRIDELRARLDRDSEDAEARSELRTLSKKAMIRVNLEGRILVFLEPPEMSLFEALKPILSHDKWESLYQTVDKSSSGEQRTKKILLVGWPTMIFASAKDQDTWAMWPELQSRCVIVSPNMSQDKYQHANQLTADLFGLPSFALKNIFPEDLEIAAKEEVRRLRQMMDQTRVLGASEGRGSKRDNFVFNPFAQQLAKTFPHESGLRMRQFRSLMSYINILAMVNGEGRPRLIVKDQARAVIATLRDIHRARDLVFSSIWANLPRYKLDFFESIVMKAYEGNSREIGGKWVFEPVPTKVILAKARELGAKVGPNRLRKTFLEPLEEAGLLSSQVDPDDKRGLAWVPIPISPKLRQNAGMPQFEPDSVKQSLKTLSDRMGDLIPNYSYPNGKLVSDLNELVKFILEDGGEGVDPSSHTTSDKPLEAPSDEVHDKSPEEGAVQASTEKRGVGTPTPPPPKLKSKCVDCGKEAEIGENFHLNGVGNLCREHFLGRKKDGREDPS